jgi:hypothetical protein
MQQMHVRSIGGRIYNVGRRVATRERAQPISSESVDGPLFRTALSGYSFVLRRSVNVLSDERRKKRIKRESEIKCLFSA